MQRLQNKVALVTGASRGIGAAIADAFEREGATVVRSDLLEIKVPGAIRLDVRKEADWGAAMAAILATHGACISCEQRGDNRIRPRSRPARPRIRQA